VSPSVSPSASVSPSVSPSSSASPSPGVDGANYCGTGANYNDGGLTAWTNPTNIQGDTTSTAATCAIGSNGGYSQELLCTNFNFSLPAGAVINGITVEVEQQSANNNRQYWSAIYLLSSGSHIGDNLSDGAAINTSKTIKSFGGATSMWGLTTEQLTKTVVESSTFGVGLKIYRSGATTTSFFRCRITVNYTSM
jgi:hypothetical protein